MKQKQYAAIAEDLRKVGTTAVAGALVSIFITDHRILTACTLVIGMVAWMVGIWMTREE
ncbi:MULTISPECIES: hypothetical protein [Pseudomonas]|uniref:hypothetical protein n=1 Tax=Pseudomonas TaxID=286 RepID=UPI00209BA360|nr:hypothetical protein [Pseudomonas guariconensis]MCO7620133.1 hypothetical protein [Pseudomonas guariconensis]